MNKYELAVVISGKLEEDEKNAVLDKVKALVERFNGKITAVDEQGKKRFAYEVQKMKEGYYNFIKFESEADTPAEIEKRIRIMDNVVRYLIVVDDVEAVAPKAPKAEENADNEAAAE
ncbi:MAG: 30S ribosomal protein S6 [Lachnospiraceae bacterium]|nr:30S ribosomal protein S6 [Lachnospiraceae bacterium]